VESFDLQAFAPYIQQLSFGALAGFAAGYALKKVGKLAAVGFGLLFGAIQVLAYYGFLTVNWQVVQDSMDPLLEPESLSSFWQGLVGILTYNVTFAAVFVPALWIGIRRG
jgi:uncharacterized membrane protein (Fun14 family)